HGLSPFLSFRVVPYFFGLFSLCFVLVASFYEMQGYRKVIKSDFFRKIFEKFLQKSKNPCGTRVFEEIFFEII
ncbi:MAG: hypothetical protein IJR95_09650, partial [Lachnospiraceae bacterium]|nr:hypothetical protein [Lachnospiraceae bacterium]